MFDGVGGYVEACKVDAVSGKDELVWIEDNAMATTSVQPVSCFKEAVFNVVRQEQYIIVAFDAVINIINNSVISPCVAIPRGDVSLRHYFIVVATQRRDEGGQVAVFFADWNAMVPVPGI